MRKDILTVGDIFNKIYVGPNQAYAKVNGKTTNILEKVEGDKIHCRQLWSDSGSILHPLVQDNTWTWTMSALMASEYEIIKITDPETEGFIHHKVLNLKECFELGVVTKEQILYRFRDQSENFIRYSPICCHSIKINHRIVDGVADYDFTTKQSFNITVEPFTHPKYPYLGSVSFLYDTREELYDDVDSVFGVKSWRSF